MIETLPPPSENHLFLFILLSCQLDEWIIVVFRVELRWDSSTNFPDKANFSNFYSSFSGSKRILSRKYYSPFVIHLFSTPWIKTSDNSFIENSIDSRWRTEKKVQCLRFPSSYCLFQVRNSTTIKANWMVPKNNNEERKQFQITIRKMSAFLSLINAVIVLKWNQLHRNYSFLFLKVNQ